MKLIRDRIPEIIEKQGKKAIVTTLNQEAYYQALLDKLQEETTEFLADQNPEELCDILEVVYALAKTMNLTPANLEQLRKQKALKNGAFTKRLKLLKIQEKEMDTMIRKHLYFSGHVQGVGFRYTTMQYAKHDHLTGWVRNLYDGRVEMEVQGEVTKLEYFIELLKNRFEIKQIQMKECELVQEEKDFDLKW